MCYTVIKSLFYLHHLDTKTIGTCKLISSFDRRTGVTIDVDMTRGNGFSSRYSSRVVSQKVDSIRRQVDSTCSGRRGVPEVRK